MFGPGLKSRFRREPVEAQVGLGSCWYDTGRIMLRITGNAADFGPAKDGLGYRRVVKETDWMAIAYIL